MGPFQVISRLYNSHLLRGPLGMMFSDNLGVKQPGREVDHSHPPSANVKNLWSHISNLALFLRGMHADILTSNYYLQAEATLYEEIRPTRCNN